jgi:hypothetical protein
MERKNKFVGSRNSYEPHTFGEVQNKYFASNEPLAVAYRKRAFEKQGWNPNTELAVDLKTLLRNDRRMVTGKEYRGIFRLDSEAVVDEFLSRDPHYTFIETLPPMPAKHNPQVFRGEYITITRRADGTYRPNFRPIEVGQGFRVEKYATGVANELLWALEGLVGKSV